MRSLAWFGIAWLVYTVATHHLPMINKHYVYLAQAFLNGSLSVANPPTSLVEVIAFRGGNYFAYGPWPALLLVPFVALWGLAFEPASIVIAIGAANVALMYRILGRLGYEQPVTGWLAALFAFGTVHFHATIWATTWLFMQVAAVCFLLLAIHEALGRNRGLVVGLCFGAAVLSRNAVLLSAPFFLIMMNRKGWSWSRNALFAGGVLICLGAGAWYNIARFGDALDNGYGKAWRLPREGLYSLRYLKRNLSTYLLALPERIGQFPYLRPSLYGMSLFLTTPAFLGVFRAAPRTPVAIASWLAIAGMGGSYLLYFWGGYAQFGVRYTLDFTPFLIILSAVGFSAGWRSLMRPLVVLSVLVNLWGVAWWRFGHLAIP